MYDDDDLPPPPRRVRWIALALVIAVAAGSFAALVSLLFRDDGDTAPAPPRRTVSLANPDAKFFWEEPDKEHRSLVPLDEIVSGGPAPDGIPPIDEPEFLPLSGGEFLAADEPVMALEIDGDARAYPLQIMLWHEIVNDTVGGVPVVVTYCPLCNSAITFERTIDGVVDTFGTSGRLYNSDLVMYDRQTKSLWVQFTGQAVVGPHIGAQLKRVPSNIVSWREFKAAFPRGTVLSRRTGFDRPYSLTPYPGYDSTGPFAFTGKTDGRLEAQARVVGVRTSAGSKAYPVTALRARGEATVVNDQIAKTKVVVFYRRGTLSALDERSLKNSADVGQSGAFSRTVNGTTLDFAVRRGAFVDLQTGSTWNIFGTATAGALKGSRLTALEKVDTFWFAWAVFIPNAPVWRP